MHELQVSKSCWHHIEGSVFGDTTPLGNVRITGSQSLGSNELSLSLLSRRDSNGIPRARSHESISSISEPQTGALSRGNSSNGNGNGTYTTHNGGNTSHDNSANNSSANSAGTVNVNTRSLSSMNKSFSGSFLSSARDLFPHHQSWPVLKLYCHEGARDLQDIAQFAADVSYHTLSLVTLSSLLMSVITLSHLSHSVRC